MLFTGTIKLKKFRLYGELDDYCSTISEWKELTKEDIERLIEVKGRVVNGILSSRDISYMLELIKTYADISILQLFKTKLKM